MNTLLLIARFSLAGIFLISVDSKLLDLSGFRQALSNFGLPRLALGTLALILLLAELGVARGLVAVPTTWFAAMDTLGLLLLFTIAIAVNMARGRRPSCHCFSQLSSKPIDWHTFLRNRGHDIFSSHLL